MRRVHGFYRKLRFSIKISDNGFVFCELEEAFKQFIKSLLITNLWVNDLVFELISDVIEGDIDLVRHGILFIKDFFPLNGLKPLHSLDLVEAFQSAMHVALN